MTVLALRAKRSKRTIPGAVKWKRKKGTKDRMMFKKKLWGGWWYMIKDTNKIKIQKITFSMLVS